MELAQIMRVVPLGGENLELFRPFFPEDFLPRLEDGRMGGLGLVYRKTACGALLYGAEGEIVTLHWVYVAPDYRRRRLGSLLLGELTAAAWAARRPVRLAAAVPGEEAALLAFLERAGFRLTPQGGAGRFTLGELRASPLLKRGGRALTLEEVPEPALRRFLRRLDRAGELLLDPADRAGLWDALSTVTVRENELASCLLLRRTEEGLSVEFLYLDPASAGPDFAALLGRSAAQAAAAGLPDGTVISADCVEPRAAELLRRLVPGRTEAPFYGGELDPETKEA